MIEETDFETFLYISKNKYQIFVNDKKNLKNLYNKELKISEEIDLNSLSKFLDDNIYKIEKEVNSFIKNKAAPETRRIHASAVEEYRALTA